MKERDMYWDEDVLRIQNEVRRSEAEKLNLQEELDTTSPSEKEEEESLIRED